MSLETEGPIVPAAIERAGQFGLVITWSNGQKLSYTAVKLRDGCPCASCREKQRAKEQAAQANGGKPRGLPVLAAGELQPLRIVQMRPLGNYAYHIDFSDGHDSGIFTFELLRQLGTP